MILYLTSCLLGFCIILGICLSLLFFSPETLVSTPKILEKSKKELFDFYLKEEAKFQKGLFSKEQWIYRKRKILEDFRRFLL